MASVVPPAFVGDARPRAIREGDGNDDDGSSVALVVMMTVLGVVVLLLIAAIVRRNARRADDEQKDLDDLDEEVAELDEDAKDAAAAPKSKSKPKPKPASSNLVDGSAGSAQSGVLVSKVRAFGEQFNTSDAPKRTGKTATNAWSNQALRDPGNLGGASIPQNAQHRTFQHTRRA